jgi:hypothetical protein
MPWVIQPDHDVCEVGGTYFGVVPIERRERPRVVGRCPAAARGGGHGQVDDAVEGETASEQHRAAHHEHRVR